MKVILICSSDLIAIPTALKLQEAGLLKAVVLPEIHKANLLPSFIAAGISAEIIHTVTKEHLTQQLTALIHRYEAATVFVLTFPWKISETVLCLPVNGCINLHPGILPKYKGADPVFWQLKNREINGGIAAHIMTNEIDDGPIILMETMSIIPGEPYGMHCQRIGIFIREHILKIVELIETKALPTPQLRDNNEDVYFKKPNKTQLSINWQKQTSIEIEALINACNPKYTGAITSIRGMTLALVEVSPADVNNVAQDVLPGTIVYADAIYGLVVKCCDDQFLKINIVCMPEGYISSTKMFNLGFRPGETFS